MTVAAVTPKALHPRSPGLTRCRGCMLAVTCPEPHGPLKPEDGLGTRRRLPEALMLPAPQEPVRGRDSENGGQAGGAGGHSSCPGLPRENLVPWP